MTVEWLVASRRNKSCVEITFSSKNHFGKLRALDEGQCRMLQKSVRRRVFDSGKCGRTGERNTTLPSITDHPQ